MSIIACSRALSPALVNPHQAGAAYTSRDKTVALQMMWADSAFMPLDLSNLIAYIFLAVDCVTLSICSQSILNKLIPHILSFLRSVAPTITDSYSVDNRFHYIMSCAVDETKATVSHKLKDAEHPFECVFRLQCMIITSWIDYQTNSCQTRLVQPAIKHVKLLI